MVDVDTLRLQGEQGDLWAQFTLGEMHRIGDGVAQDLAEAARWYRMAAEGHYRDADFLLGLMHLKGEGVSEDHGEAFKRFYSASTGGHREAARCLARMYEVGLGIPHDAKQAAHWLALADRKWGMSEPWYYHGQMQKGSMKGRLGSEVDYSAGGGLFLMTGPVDDRTCIACLDELHVVRTAEEWETIEPVVFAGGMHEGCRCSLRRVHSIDRKLQEMQRVINWQMDIQKYIRGIYWRPIMILGGTCQSGKYHPDGEDATEQA